MTLNIRSIYFGLILQIIGFLIYTLPFHPIFLLVGRAVIGVSDPFASIASGEIFRTYNEQESTVAVVWLSAVYAIGFMIGPVLNFLFADIQFNLGPIPINNFNFIGIFMSIFLVVQLVLSNFLVHDCSREFNLKELSEKNISSSLHRPPTHPSVFINSTSSLSERSHLLGDQSNSGVRVYTVLKDLLTNRNTLLLLVATCVFMYGFFAMSVGFSLIVTVLLKWGLVELSVLYVAGGLATITTLTILARWCTTKHRLYVTSVLCIGSLILNCGLLVCIKVLERNKARDILMVVMFTALLTLGYGFDGVVTKVIFASMVPSDIQCLSESVRCGVSRVAIVVGSLTVAFMLPWIKLWSTIVILVNTVLLLLFFMERKKLIYPVEIAISDQ